MRNFIVSILAVLYLGLSTGATIHVHYCMGKLVGSSLWSNEKSEECSKCGMHQKAYKHKCCKDEHQVVKIIQDQKVADDVYHSVQIASTEFVLNHFIISEPFVSSIIGENPYSNAPPLNYEVPIYIRNCVFRI